ncbi:unnamed protein product [Cladocopium goreaui]|uniref:Superoxide dismutase [Fe] n=1 Tax=Cladocopium goreaui TaxID=2562237 RepID=A0A9P1BY55_9DINO|nr:unnamed protein product [Cladocopium goreaui]
MAWKSSLKAAGFGIDLYGFPDMLAAVRTHHGDPSIRRLSEEVERHLRFQPGDLFGSKAGALKQTSSAAEAAAVSEVDVQVTVTHPTDRDSVVVTVPGSANMKHVKEALAAKLGRPEITRNGRMVIESQNGDLLPVPDGQRLGGKRQVLMVGISLSAPAASFANAVPTPAGPEPKSTRDRPLNLGEAKELLKAFREIASSKEFQRTLGNIHKQGPDSVQKMQPMFIGQSFNRTLAMYDFPLTNEGYQDMARGISKHSWNVHVKAQAHEVERLLRMPPGSFFGIPGEAGQEPEYPPLEQDEPKARPKMQPKVQPKTQPSASSRSRFIEVVAKHAVDNSEVRVELPQNATFYDCKQAISKLLGRDEILRKGRLVQKKGGVYSAFKDDDPLGETRQVLVLGADLRTEEDSHDEAMPPVHPYAEMKRPPQHIATEPPGRPQPYAVKSRPQEELNVPPPRVSDFRDGMETPQTASQPVPARFEPQTRAEPKPKVVAKPKPPPPPPEEYEIRIKHAVEAGEVPLKIWTNWTFGAVRDALSKKLKRDDIQKKARFVFKAGTGTAPWIAFKDHEIVGWNPDGSRRNELMLLGVELEPEREGPLSLELTQRLLEEFEKACGQEETQVALQKLLDRGGVALQLGLTQLMGQASQRAAEQLQLGHWKLQRLMDAVKASPAHGSDRSIQELSSRVEKTLRLEPGKLFGLRQASTSSTASAIKGLLGRSQDWMYRVRVVTCAAAVFLCRKRCAVGKSMIYMSFLLDESIVCGIDFSNTLQGHTCF